VDYRRPAAQTLTGHKRKRPPLEESKSEEKRVESLVAAEEAAFGALPLSF
jgi:hypothetical protein